MARISRVTYENASDEVKQVMDGHKAKGYRITNMKETLLHSIPAFQALEDGVYGMIETVQTFLGKRATEFLGYAISAENDCLICSNYFRKILVDQGIDFDTFEFTDEENLLIAFGRAYTQNAAHIPDELLDELAARYSEKQIVEITAYAAMIVANNTFNNALQVDLDDYLLPYQKK